MEEKLYAVNADQTLSAADLLQFFARHGSTRVSDLHLKVGVPPVYRIDGQLQKMKGNPLDGHTVELLARAIVPQSKWPRLIDQRSLDASLVVSPLHFRFNVFFENDGLAVAVRALHTTPPDVETIGFPTTCWRDIIHRQFGLVLVTGITGAGKSTTIASLISRIADTRACRIITIEDPIEYRLSGRTAVISQRELGRDLPSFERGLRDCLREDPDVIFVGEMRDRESATWTLTAAETGHLVFSTLHTRDVRGSITRILDMFPPMQQDEVASQLSLGLSHIICQKLIPRSDGQGRVVAMEILNNSYAVANYIRQKKVEQIYSILQQRVRDLPEERMITLERSLAILVKQGLVSAMEAEKWVNHPQVFLDEMQHLK
jgi:twitching motility protein PilT